MFHFIFLVPGRKFDVEIFYTKSPMADYISATVTTVFQIHTSNNNPGDILVFLPGQEDIELAMEILKARSKHLTGEYLDIFFVQIYSSLPSELQAEIFKPTPKGSRKVKN